MSQQLPTGRSASDWALFALLTLFWAGAYALTRVAVDKGNPDMGLPVAWVSALYGYPPQLPNVHTPAALLRTYPKIISTPQRFL